MTEFNFTPTKLGDLDAEDRFALALFASLVLHLALIPVVQVKVVSPSGITQSAMEVRIERAPQAEVKPLLLTESVAESTAEKPEEPKPSEEKPAPEESAPAILPTLEIPLLEDPTWYPAKQVDVHPSALNLIKPAYPEKGVELGVDGKVVLLLLIDETGVVKEASVVEADPEGVFEESALAAFREARFAPAQKNGRAVKSRVLIRVSYELNDRKKPAVVQPPLPLTP